MQSMTDSIVRANMYSIVKRSSSGITLSLQSHGRGARAPPSLSTPEGWITQEPGKMEHAWPVTVGRHCHVSPSEGLLSIAALLFLPNILQKTRLERRLQHGAGKEEGASQRRPRRR